MVCYCMQSVAREAALEKIWDDAVVQSTNSLLRYVLYSEEAGGQAVAHAQWQAQGSTTQTHSDLVSSAHSCLHA